MKETSSADKIVRKVLINTQKLQERSVLRAQQQQKHYFSEERKQNTHKSGGKLSHLSSLVTLIFTISQKTAQVLPPSNRKAFNVGIKKNK